MKLLRKEIENWFSKAESIQTLIKWILFLIKMVKIGIEI